MKRTLLLAAVPGALVLSSALAGMTQEGPQVGYDDTPHLPDSTWRVHDKARPRPPVIAPGEGMAAPSDALVLFDGTSLAAWQKGDGSPATWALEDGAMVVNGTGGIQTAESFGDMQLHLEWATPKEVSGDSQGRGNSGVFLMGAYEVQILDSFENPSYADGQAAALYGQRPPDVNACRAPGEWQTYDIVFSAPRFEDDALVKPAVVTLFHNGVLVHNAQPFLGRTAHRAVATYAPGPDKAPLGLQDHGNPIRFRNIWVRPL